MDFRPILVAGISVGVAKTPPTHLLRTAMPTVWDFVATFGLGVGIGDVLQIWRRYYGNAPIYPVFERDCGGKNCHFREEYLIRYGKEKCTYEYEKLLYNVQK